MASLEEHEHIDEDNAAIHLENQESEQTLNQDQLDQTGANFTKAAVSSLLFTLVPTI